MEKEKIKINDECKWRVWNAGVFVYYYYYLICISLWDIHTHSPLLLLE